MGVLFIFIIYLLLRVGVLFIYYLFIYLRTVSELVRYLSSAEESVVPELERPIYAPETIKTKLKDNWKDPESLDTYVKLVEQELQNKNCIIVASPDVNPLTEVVLARAYGVPDIRFKAPCKVDDLTEQKIVVALKGWRDVKTKLNSEGEVTESNGTKEQENISLFFSRTGKQDGLEQGKRGFLVEKRVIEREYKSQDEAKEGEIFRLLSHLVLIKNPFSKPDIDTFIVLLNGVSGPGTFAVAELLTGGKSTAKAVASEKMLGEFNRVWQNADNERKRTGKHCGVEAIVEVLIEPKIQPASGVIDSVDSKGDGNELQRTVGGKFYDQRQVVSWNFPEEQLVAGNPRFFTFDSSR